MILTINQMNSVRSRVMVEIRSRIGGICFNFIFVYFRVHFNLYSIFRLVDVIVSKFQIPNVNSIQFNSIPFYFIPFHSQFNSIQHLKFTSSIFNSFRFNSIQNSIQKIPFHSFKPYMQFEIHSDFKTPTSNLNIHAA